MQEFTEKDCMQTEKEASIQNRVVVLPSKVLPEHYTGQLFFCTNIQKTENPRHSIAHLVSLSTGEAWHCWKDDLSRCAESGTVSTGTEGRGDGDDLEMREGK